MEKINDSTLRHYKNYNPWLEDDTTNEITIPSDGLTAAPTGKDLDNVISNEMILGNDTNLYVNPNFSDTGSGQVEDLHYNNFAKQIIFAGADFAKNFFDTFLFAVKNDGNVITQTDAFNEMAKESYDHKENMPNVWRTVGMYSFTTRTTKVEIPQPKAQTFDYVNGVNTIRKVKAEWDMTKKSSLTMRIDGLAYYIDTINLLSQNNDNSKLDNQRGIDNLSFMGFNKQLSENLKNGTRLDLVVRHVNLTESNKNGYIKNAERVFYREKATPNSLIGMANTRPDNARSMFWVFEDVKFLGWTDGLEFGHSNTGSQELTTEFIYKRLIRVDPMYLENYLGGTYQAAFTRAKIKDSGLPSELISESNYQKV